jgi:hypothetical protein
MMMRLFVLLHNNNNNINRCLNILILIIPNERKTRNDFWRSFGQTRGLNNYDKYICHVGHLGETIRLPKFEEIMAPFSVVRLSV